MFENIESHPYYYFYKVGNQKFSTKLFASYAKEKSDNNTNEILWCFPHYENALINENLELEPSETLQELYLQRAIELRNKYDYLILYYSGGNDSNQILETFMLNKIFLDEIVIFSKEDMDLKNKIQDEEKLLFFVPEYYEASKSAIPQAKFYIETYSPRTKLTIVENINNVNGKYWESLNFENIERHLKSCNLGLSSRIVVRSRDLSFVNSSLSKIISNKNIGHIYGKEKVRVSYDESGFFISISDADVIDYIDLQWLISEKNTPNNMELFYIHPDSIKIHIKQAHEIIKKIPKKFVNSIFKQSYFATRSIEDLFANILYVRKHERLYTGLKAANSYEYLANHPNRQKQFENSSILIKRQRGEMAVNYYIKDKGLDNLNRFSKIIQDSFFKNRDLDYVTNIHYSSYSTKKYYIKYF